MFMIARALASRGGQVMAAAADASSRAVFNRDAELLDYVLNKDDFRIDGGYIHALPKPGLGVEVDEERVIHASRNPPDWHNPVWRHADGSVAEW